MNYISIKLVSLKNSKIHDPMLCGMIYLFKKSRIIGKQVLFVCLWLFQSGYINILCKVQVISFFLRIQYSFLQIHYCQIYYSWYISYLSGYNKKSNFVISISCLFRNCFIVLKLILLLLFLNTIFSADYIIIYGMMLYYLYYHL